MEEQGEQDLAGQPPWPRPWARVWEQARSMAWVQCPFRSGPRLLDAVLGWGRGGWPREQPGLCGHSVGLQCQQAPWLLA